MDKIKVVCPNCGAVNAIPANREIRKANCGKCGYSLLDTHPVNLNESNFNHFIEKNDIPVVVDFWAPWCGPCQMMAPNFEAAAKSFPLKARFAKLNTEEAPGVAARYGIRGIPTMIIFKNGQEVARESGAMDASTIARWVSQYI